MADASTYALAYTVTPASSAPLHKLALTLSTRYHLPVPPRDLIVLSAIPPAPFEGVQAAVDSWRARLDIAERTSSSRKVELQVVDLLVERDRISAGLKANLRPRASKQGRPSGQATSDLFAELHSALLHDVPLPGPSSQIFRLPLLEASTLQTTSNNVDQANAEIDTLDVWRKMRGGGQIANGGRCRSGLSVAGVSSVEVEAVVLLRKELGAEQWEETGRASVV